MLLLVTAATAAPGGSNLLLSLGNAGVDSIAPDGSGRQTVLPTDNSGASYSADGTRLAYVRSTQIIVADGDGQNPEIVNHGPFVRSAAQPSLSPDGSHVVFLGDGQHLYVASVTGQDVRQITGSTQRDEGPRWSPRGDVIVFTRRTDVSRPELYFVGPTGGDQQITFGGANTYSSAPAWSPDGGRIAFIEETYQGSHIAVMNADGSGHQSITPEFPQPFGLAAPAWSPDGSRLAFMEQVRKLDVIDVNGQNWNTLIPDVGAEVGTLVWRPAGAGVAVDLAGPNSPVARRPLSITGNVRSLGLLPVTNLVVSIATGNARVTKATLGGAACSVSTGSATCTASTVPGDTDLPLSVFVTPAHSGNLTFTLAATASNDFNQTDNQTTIELAVSSCTVLGTAADDKLRARGGDSVCALDGDDTIKARNGKADTIDGGPGTDTAVVDANDRVRRVEHVLRPKSTHR